MPVKSKAQRRFMYAVKAGKVEGVSPDVGAEFLAHSPQAPLPERKSSKKKSSKKAPKKNGRK